MGTRIFILVAALVALTSVGLALSKDSGSGPQRAAARIPQRSASALVSQGLRDRFAVLRLTTPRTAADEVALGQAAPQAPSSGVAFDQARRVATLGTLAVWIAPSSNGLCFFDRDLDPSSREIGPGSSCGTDDALVLHGQFWMTRGNAERGGADLVALVPDGVENATVTFTDGTTTDVPIRNNTLALHVLKDTAGYSYEQDGHTVRVSARTFRD